MGKGIVKENLGAGKYRIQYIFETSRAQDAITLTTRRIAALQILIDDMRNDPGRDETQWQLLHARLVAYRTGLDWLNSRMPDENARYDVWCVDHTDDLSINAEVGTLEHTGEVYAYQMIDGEIIWAFRSERLKIQPGYDGNAAYSSTRDGIMQPAFSADAWAWFYNICLLPGWQKWKPRYRFGTITALDQTNDTCTIELDAAFSTAQGININTQTEHEFVPIEYMTCDSEPFQIGDNVVVEFTGQIPTDPVVIGYQDNPKLCRWENWNGPLPSSTHPWDVALYDGDWAYQYPWTSTIFNNSSTWARYVASGKYIQLRAYRQGTGPGVSTAYLYLPAGLGQTYEFNTRNAVLKGDIIGTSLATDTEGLAYFMAMDSSNVRYFVVLYANPTYILPSDTAVQKWRSITTSIGSNYSGVFSIDLAAEGFQGPGKYFEIASYGGISITNTLRINYITWE